MARTPPSRVSREKIVADLRRAAQKGDRAALALALDRMRTLALSPRYWDRYLAVLRHPLARLVDLLVIKQGDRIAHQKGWKRSRATARSTAARTRTPARRRPPGRPAGSAVQTSLFD
jgi:hypothetical protein